MKHIEEQFYNDVAELLACIDHTYIKRPYSIKTRWNNRDGGNGRYPGNGIVRRYSANMIHVQLHNPVVVGIFDNSESVIAAIKLAMAFK